MDVEAEKSRHMPLASGESLCVVPCPQKKKGHSTRLRSKRGSNPSPLEIKPALQGHLFILKGTALMTREAEKSPHLNAIPFKIKLLPHEMGDTCSNIAK